MWGPDAAITLSATLPSNGLISVSNSLEYLLPSNDDENDKTWVINLDMFPCKNVTKNSLMY